MADCCWANSHLVNLLSYLVVMVNMSMSDTLLSIRDIEERLSIAYVLAVAARAGYTTSERDLDRDGIDLSIQAGGSMRPALDLQLKATSRLRPPKNGKIRFRLPVRN